MHGALNNAGVIKKLSEPAKPLQVANCVKCFLVSHWVRIRYDVHLCALVVISCL